jgi:hypothetical protein
LLQPFTDTLRVSRVWLDFPERTISAKIQRGTVIDGAFVENMPALQITVDRSGSFISNDGTWTGTVESVPGLLDSLRSEFDSFILTSGSVTGTTA